MTQIGRIGCMLPGELFFVTLTAPGVDVLPWDRSMCSHPSDVRCSGAIGCRVVHDAAAAWNASFTSRADDFWTDVRRSRTLNPHRGRVEKFRGVELQARGALHGHFLVRSTAGLRLSKGLLRSLARRHGFGVQVDVRRATADDAMYLSKYVCEQVVVEESMPFKRRDPMDVDGFVRVLPQDLEAAEHRAYLAACTEQQRRYNHSPGEGFMSDDEFARTFARMHYTLAVKVARERRAKFPPVRRWSASRGWGASMAMIRRLQSEWVRSTVLGEASAALAGGPAEPDAGGAAGALDNNSESSATGFCPLAASGGTLPV